MRKGFVMDDGFFHATGYTCPVVLGGGTRIRGIQVFFRSRWSVEMTAFGETGRGGQT